ncbi:MAG: RDD family protein [Candidatus Kapabacteria bacterium]|nr:RDD family protein [Candidatus Kapabacteria bacterium]
MENGQIPPPPAQGPSVNPFGSYQPTIEDYRADFGIRLGAIVIDGLFATLLTAFIALILSPLDLPIPEILQEAQESMQEALNLFGVTGESRDLAYSLLGSSSYAGAIAPILYMLIEGLTGASIGKRLLKLTVARADGTPGDTSLFLSRMFVKNSDRLLHLIAILPLLTFLSGPVESAASTIGFVLFIGCFLALGRKRQALHDMVVKTAVFKVQFVKNDY